MTGRVEVRAARPAEYPAVLETVCAAFGERVRPLMSAMLWGDPTLTDEDIRVAVVEGAIASAARIADRRIHFGSDTLRLAGIGAVSTHPDYRGRGLASLVMDDAARSMRERGFPLGMLFTGIPSFYARLGWSGVPQPGIRVDLATLVALGDETCRGDPTSGRPDSDLACELAVAVRPFDESRDLLAVEAIYDAFNREAYGPYLRSPAYWTCAHSRERHIMPALVAQHDGEVVAYASAGPHDDTMAVYEAACLSGAEDVFAPLAAAVIAQARDQKLASVTGWLPPDHAMRAAFRSMDEDACSDVTHHGMMLLPLDMTGIVPATTGDAVPVDRDPGWMAALFPSRSFVYWWPDHF